MCITKPAGSIRRVLLYRRRADFNFAEGGNAVGSAGAADGNGGRLGGALHDQREIITAGNAGDEIAGEGIARSGGIHGLDGEHGLEHFLITAHAVRAVAAKRQHNASLGIALLEHGKNLVGLGFIRQRLALDFVKQEPVHAPQRIGMQTLVDGGGVEHDGHAALGGHAHDERRVIQLVLQNEEIALFKAGEHLFDVLAKHAHVFTGKNDDAVLAVLVHLNHGVAGGAGHVLDVLRIHAALGERVHQNRAVLTHNACVIHSAAGLGDGDGLVEAPAAGEHIPRLRHLGFTRLNHMINLIHIINVHRTIIQDFHHKRPLTKHVKLDNSFCLVYHSEGKLSTKTGVAKEPICVIIIAFD